MVMKLCISNTAVEFIPSSKVKVTLKQEEECETKSAIVSRTFEFSLQPYQIQFNHIIPAVYII